MKIALAQLNPIIGDIAANSDKIRHAILHARDAGADLVVFPELSVIGYPPRDLLLKTDVIRQCENAIQQLAAECTGIAAIIGYPCLSDAHDGRTLYNAAAFCRDGQIVHRHLKCLLPTYDVFDEHRYFEPGPPGQIVEFHNRRIGITICEDLWNDQYMFERQLYRCDPIQSLVDHGAQVLVNLSASPFYVDKHRFRRDLFSHTAKRFGVPLLYCNQVGGNDDLVFDGNSCAFDAAGNLIAHARSFEEDLLIVELSVGDEHPPDYAPYYASDHPTENPPRQSQSPSPHTAASTNRVEQAYEGIESVYHALVLGLRDYCKKCGFTNVVIGLSGGIDSAVTAALCVAALGHEQVRGVAMPSRFSSQHSIDDARDLAQRLHMQFDLIQIDPAHSAVEHMLAPLFENLPPDVTEENIQARVRGVTLMAISNKFGSMLVTTGNKSELAVGYCTLYGDMCGGLAVLSDVPKTMVWELARWINENSASPLRRKFTAAVIPENSITKPPSAELRPDQVDQDSLPPYEILDEIIELYVEREQSVDQIVKALTCDPQTVSRMVRLIDLNEYKRKQAPPGLKVTSRAFGTGRRMPIAQKYKPSDA